MLLLLSHLIPYARTCLHNWMFLIGCCRCCMYIYEVEKKAEPKHQAGSMQLTIFFFLCTWYSKFFIIRSMHSCAFHSFTILIWPVTIRSSFVFRRWCCCCCRCRRCLLLCYVVVVFFFRSWIESVSGHWLILFKYHNHSWQWKCNLFQIETLFGALGFGSIRDSRSYMYIFFFSFFLCFFCFCILFHGSILGSLCLTQSTLLSGAIMRNEDKLWSFNMLYVSHTITFIKLLTLRAVFFSLSFVFLPKKSFFLSLWLWQCATILIALEHEVEKKKNHTKAFSIVIHLMN